MYNFRKDNFMKKVNYSDDLEKVLAAIFGGIGIIAIFIIWIIKDIIEKIGLMQ